MAEPVETQTVYDTALTFFNSLSKVIVSQPSTHSASNLRAARPNFIIQHPQNHWKKPYVGPSCDVVRDKIREYEGKFSVTGRKYYSKALTPLQSNGTGKSRFANEYGNICSMITHVIRQPDSGFPPSDEAVYYFMRSCPSDQDKENLQSRQLSTDSDEKANYVWFHAMAIGILQATFHHCNERVKGIEGSTERNSIGLAAKFKEFLGDVKELSARTASYDDVVKAAKEISASCVKD